MPLLTGRTTGINPARAPVYTPPPPVNKPRLQAQPYDAPPAGNPPLLDAVGPAGGAGVGVPYSAAASSLTWDHIVGSGTGKLLLVGVAVGNDSTVGGDNIPLAVTANGVSVPSIGKLHSNNAAAGYGELFLLQNPASGTQTIVAATSGTVPQTLAAGSVSFLNAAQEIPEIAMAYGASPPGPSGNAPPGDSSSVDVSFVFDGSAISASGNTLLWLRNTFAYNAAGNAAMSMASPGTGVIPMSWTAADDWWGMMNLNIRSFVAPAASNDQPGWASAMNI